jgi:serine/threonine protein kinase
VYDDCVSLTGTVLGGRYRVGAMLGRGGMGAVYEAVQQGIERAVALKVMHAHLQDDPLVRARFEREARVVAMLRHPNLVQINDYVESPDEPPFLVMERLHGETLRDVMKRTSRLPADRVARIVVQMLAALDAAHRAGVVHRDIKPDNVFLEHTTAQKDLVKLLDFGVAKFLGKEDDAVKLTRQGHAIGTPAFMSPEQAMGEPIDGRTDLYAVGATMYQALTGQKPLAEDNLADLMHALASRTPAPVTSLRPDVDPALSRVIDRALAKRPDERFATALDMARALESFTKTAPPAASTLVSAPAAPHDTVRDPVAQTAPLPYQPPVPPARPPWVPPARPAGSGQTAIAIALASALLLAGVLVAFGILHAKEVSVAPLAAPAATAPAAPTASSLPGIWDPPESLPSAAPSASPAEPPHVAGTAEPAATVAAPAESGSEPHVCRSARLAKQQHAGVRIVARLERMCRQQGGQP